MTCLLGIYILGAIVTYVFVIGHSLKTAQDMLDFLTTSGIIMIALPFYPIWVPLWIVGKLSGLE